MDTKNLTQMILAVSVAVVLLAGVLIPVLDEATNGEVRHDYYNNGPYFAAVDDKGTTHTMVISTGTDGFVIKTDNKSTITPNMAGYKPAGTYTAPAIAIAVYEGYNDNGVLTSQAGVTPTASQNIDVFRGQALNGNIDNTNGTYQLWNYFMKELYNIMGWTVMGNTDSQYMLGPGVTSGGQSATTGGTSSAYEVSTGNTDSVALFIENGWGSLWEFVGDTYSAEYELQAGNTLGGRTVVTPTVVSILDGTVTLPSTTNMISTIFTTSEAFGTPLTTTASASTAGEGINDKFWVNSGNRCLIVGGNSGDGSDAGLSASSANGPLSNSYALIGSRLAYIMGADSAPIAPSDFGYVITLGAGGSTITDVQALIDGTLTSEMPTGTTLNSYWDFDTTTGVGPFGSYYAAINLGSGTNADDVTEARLSTDKGAIGYILDPTDLTKTLGGTSYTSGLYNIMLVIPTVYWYVDNTDATAPKLYVGSSADMFDGITMKAYAHTYTQDYSVDTKNPSTKISTSLAIGEDAVLRLYSDGGLYVITETERDFIGYVDSLNPITVTIKNDVLTYTASGDTDPTTVDKMLAYLANKGVYSMCLNPVVADTSEIILGGYVHSITTTESDTVSIGYCASGEFGTFSATDITATLDPYNETDSELQTVTTAVAVTSHTQEGTSDKLKQIDSIVFTGTWPDTGESTATYTYFLAPHDVVYYSEGDYEWAQIMQIIPIFIVIGIIVGLAYTLFRKS